MGDMGDRMTQDEIIKMYVQVADDCAEGNEWCCAGIGEPLQRFANLVSARAAAVEREACAKVCDKASEAGSNTAYMLAKEIRSRRLT